MIPIDRRQFLGLGATTAALALAGCSESTDTSPSYTDWIPTQNEAALTAYIDFNVAKKTSKIDPILPLFLPASDVSTSTELVPNVSELDRIDEPLLRLPLQTGGRVIGVSALWLAASGLSYLIAPGNPAQGVTELFRANNTAVGTGDIDTDRADESLREGREDFLGKIKFEVLREDDEYTIYTPTTDVEGIVAVSESAVLMSDSQTELKTVIETKRREHDRAVQTSDAFEWLFDAAGSADMLVGWLGPVALEEFYWGEMEADPATDVVTQEKDVLSSVTFAPETREVTANLALNNSDGATISSSALATQLGIDRDAVSFADEDGRVSATTTYTDDELDIQFVEPTETPRTTTAPAGEDLPQEVAAAVPEDAFEFEYKEDEGVVRVNFVKEFEADKVTVQAVESRSEASTTTPEPISYLNVYLAAGGDEVVVTVTVDGVTGEVARRSFGGTTSSADGTTVRP